jgi:hypothetical protein
LKREWAARNPDAIKSHRPQPGRDARALDAKKFTALTFRCRRCAEVKPVKFFNSDKTRKTGIFPYCKPCTSESKKPSQTTERLRERRSANAEKIIEQRRAHAQRNRDKITKAAAERRRKDPQLRLAISLRVSVYRALRGEKRAPTFAILGYTRAALVAHLTRHLMPGMTWENYGTVWHVDHIRPVSRFVLPDQLQECWALSNLRPLWAKENMAKGNRYIGEPLPT